MNTLNMVRNVGLVGLFVVLALLAGSSGTAHANGYTVTKTADTMDFVCDADCSLREALYQVNYNQGPHTIDIPSGTYQLTIPGTGEEYGLTGDLDIQNDVEIYGDGNPIIEIDGASMEDRVIQVTGPWVVLISGVTIRGGKTLGEGGGIYSQGYLSLDNTTVSGNDAATSGGGIYVFYGVLSLTSSTVSGNHAVGDGAGIYNAGTLTLNNSTVSNNNENYGYGGGIYSSGPLNLNGTTVSGNYGNYAGGVYIEGTATINSSVVRGNTAGYYGGGISISYPGNATINNSTVRNNSASTGGGGIFNDNGNLTLNSSAISGNYAADGGGIYNFGVSGTASVTNTTISGHASFGYGGGIYNSIASLTLNSSTISSNSAYGGGGLYNYAGGTVSARNSIVADSPSGGNCGGISVDSNGFNLSSDATCAFSGAGDMINIWPGIGPLAFNGGPTPTHALQDGSPAADAGPGGSGCPAADQRGIVRPQGLRCDIGAYEAPDTDADGVSDPLDGDDDNDALPDGYEYSGCRTLAEDYDAFQDTDGCPDPDNDGDSICDAGQTGLSCTGSDSGKNCFDPAGTLSCPTKDCRNAVEDMDAFKDTDGCPEPDNDNDGKLDAADVCPGTNSLAGADGMLGSPQDLNHNGIRDAGAPWNEAALTTDDSPSALAFEDYDGVLDADGCHDSPGADFDGDGFTDDSEVFTHLTDAGNPDTDSDAVIDGSDNCPNWPNATQTVPSWAVPATDTDCDGFTVAREQWTGTDPTKHCNATNTPNDEAVDAWPTDFNDSRVTNLSDVVLMGPVYNQSTGTDPAKKRFDLNASGSVNLSDVVLMGPFYNKGCG